MYRFAVLFASLGILASLFNMDFNLWGVTALMPTLLSVNGAGALVVGWAWLD